MPALTAAAAVLAAVASTASSVAAGPSPESVDNPRVADLWTICIFMAVFFPFFIILLAFACLRLFHMPDAPGAGAAASPPEGSRRGSGGLDAAAIAAMPLVFYRDVRRHRIAEDGGALECSVCLTEFDDDDALRLLPTCPHAFHPECIGLWLEKHATCPLCRASLLDAPEPQLQPPAIGTPLPPGSPPDDHPTVVLIGDGEEEEEEDWSRIQCLARNRRAAGRQALPRSNSTGHDVCGGGGTERFALLLPEHVRVEILMSHRLRHVTSAVESVRVREGSAHGSLGGSVRNAVSRLLSRFAPAAASKGDGDDKSFKLDAEEASSLRRHDNSSRGALGEEKRSD